MNMRTQLLVIAVAFLFFVIILQLIRKEKLALRYGLLWIALSVSILLMGCFPKIITVLSDFFGVQIPANMLFFIGFCFSLMIIFSLSTALSRNSEKLKRLTQEMALLEEKIGHSRGGENE